jgi:hypothetical protein
MIVRRPERQSDQAKAAGVGKSSTNPFNDAVLRNVQSVTVRMSVHCAITKFLFLFNPYL